MKKILPWLFPGMALFLCRPGLLLARFDLRMTFLTEGLLGVLAAGFLLTEAGSLKNEFRRPCLDLPRTGLLFLILAGVVHAVRSGYHHPEVLGQGIFLPALALLVLLNRKDFLKSLTVFLTFLWALAAGVLFVERITGIAPFGITGNWNWSSMLLISCTPFVLLAFRRTRALPWLILPVLSITGWGIFHQHNSRTAIAALGITFFLWILLRFRKQRKVLFLSAVLLAAAGAGFFFHTEHAAQFLKEEIRTELFFEACSLIRHHPWGVGFCEYENRIIPFKTAEYHRHPLAAERTAHPHNELLYLASVAGIPAALVFLILAISLTGSFLERQDRHKLPPEETALFLVWFFLLVCSMGDLTCHAWPLNWIFALLTGLLLPVRSSREKMESTPPFFRIAGGAVLLTVLFFTACNGYASWHFQQARTAFRNRDFQSGATMAEKGLRVPCFDPEEIYFAAVSSFHASPERALKIASFLQTTPWKDYGHIHLLRGNIHAVRGRNGAAMEEYGKDAQCYPWDPRPLIGIIGCLERTGQTGAVPAFRKRAAELQQLKKQSSH